MASLSSVLAQIRQNESGGNYSLPPEANYAFPRSHASGAYQFQPATWQQWTNASGIGTQYSQAYLAPPGVQDAVAAYAAIHGPGVNSPSLWGASAGSGYPRITTIDVSPEQLANAGLGSDQIVSGGFVSPFTNPFADISNGSGGNFAPDSTGSFTGIPTYQQPITDTNGNTIGTDATFLPQGGVSPDFGFLTGNQIPPSAFPDSSLGAGLIASQLGGIGGGSGTVEMPNLWNSAPSISGDTVTGIIGAGPAIGQSLGDLFGTNSSQSQPNTFWNNLLTIAGDYSLRFGLILLALILIGAAAWAFSSGSAQRFIQKTVGKK